MPKLSSNAIVITILLLVIITGALVVLSSSIHAQSPLPANPGGPAGPGTPGGPGTPPGPGTPDPKTYLTDLYYWFLAVVGISALFAIVFGGVLYMFSGTSLTKTEQARSWIANGIYGIIIAAFSFALLYVINPDLVKDGFDIQAVVDNALKDAPK